MRTMISSSRRKNKSEFAGDDDAGIKIMQTSSPLDCYRIGKELNAKMDVHLWNNGPAHRIIEEGLKIKFEQNLHIKKFLMYTSMMAAVEASPMDFLCGVGISFRDHGKILDIPNWPCKNELEKLLERIGGALAVNPPSN